jgi:hypothetical protein
MCMFCRSLFVLLYFFFWPLCCLFFFDIRILITSLVSSNSSYHVNVTKNEIKSVWNLKPSFLETHDQYNIDWWLGKYYYWFIGFLDEYQVFAVSYCIRGHCVMAALFKIANDITEVCMFSFMRWQALLYMAIYLDSRLIIQTNRGFHEVITRCTRYNITW